jgi:PKHD-type hydroxylase
MLACIPRVLSSADVDGLRAALARGTFVDGALTANPAAGGIKHNLQLERTESTAKTVEAQVTAALARNLTFNQVAIPKAMTPPMFNRYEPGMAYGRHVDNPIMGGTLRADLSVTVFLSALDGYDGGELCIETDLGVEEVKLPPGDAVVYPATTVHWVAPVTRGTRLAAVTWVQSLVRDHTMRRIAHDINLVLERLGTASPGSENAELLLRAYTNLIRLVADV